jgi:hypothetical protein
MPFMRTLFPLLKMDETSILSLTGDTHRIQPSDLDSVDDTDLQFRALVHLTQQGGEGSPATKLHVETSADGQIWFDAMDPLLLDSSTELKKFTPLEVLAPLVRARVEVVGATPPQFVATVLLAGSGAFKLTRVPKPVQPNSASSIG